MSNYKIEWCGLFQNTKSIVLDKPKPQKIKEKPVQITRPNSIKQAILQRARINLLTYLDNISRDDI